MNQVDWSTFKPTVNAKELQLLTYLKTRKDFTEVIDIARRARVQHGEATELLFKLWRKKLVDTNGNGYQITKAGLGIL